jgi:hypothetical protein
VAIGDMVDFEIMDRDIPIVHRIQKVHQDWQWKGGTAYQRQQ